jgi:WD40 repeat protein
VAYSPDGRLLASVTENTPYLHIWRLSDGALLSEPTTNDGSVENGGAYGVAFSPDGTIIATSGNTPRFIAADGTSQTLSTNTVNLWDAATGALLETLPTTCGSYAAGLGFSHDGTRLVTGGMMGNIEVWSIPAGTRLLSIPFNGSVYTAHFSPDDSRLITASYLTGTVWNAATGAKIFDITGLENEMNEAAFSPDGQMILATADNGKLKVLDAAGTVLQTLTFKPATTPYFSHALWIDAARFVVDDWSGAVEEWTADGTGSFVQSHTWNENAQTLGMAISPDRTTLVVGGNAGFVFLSP